MDFPSRFDVIVIGGGHAGTEAALAAAQGQDEIIVVGSFHTVAEAMAEELNRSGN